MQAGHAQVVPMAFACLATLRNLSEEQRGYRPKGVHTSAYNEVRSAFVALGPEFEAVAPPPVVMLRPHRISYPDRSYAQIISSLERILSLLTATTCESSGANAPGLEGEGRPPAGDRDPRMAGDGPAE